MSIESLTREQVEQAFKHLHEALEPCPSKTLDQVMMSLPEETIPPELKFLTPDDWAELLSALWVLQQQRSRAPLH